MRKIYATLILTGAMLLICSCSSPNPNTNAAKTTNTTATNAKTASGTKPAPPKPGTSDPAADKNKKTVPGALTVPADWDYYADEQTGYEFKMPKNATFKDASEAGFDVYDFTSGDILSEIIVFNNKTLTKDDLFKMANDFSKEAGEKDFVVTNKRELNADYSTADYTVTDKNGKKRQGKMLVATDITDNFVFFVETDADKFAANSKTIDEILGSFSMYSGGASGNSAAVSDTKATNESK
jgi:hypothetical protein